MPAALVDSDTFSFADGNAGHVCDLGSAPDTGDLDILCVNSDTLVATPAGFTAAESAVGNQGAYVFTRTAAGGEGSTVTVTTSGDFNAAVVWSRWAATNALDTSTSTRADGSVGTSSPAHSTGTLAESGELVVAFAALHSIGDANQTSPVWSAGYTALATAVQSVGASGVRGYVGYRTDAGTAAEAPQVSWSGDACFDRYMLAVSFTAGDSVSGTLAATLPALTVSGSGEVTRRAGSTAAVAGAVTSAPTTAAARTSTAAAAPAATSAATVT